MNDLEMVILREQLLEDQWRIAKDLGEHQRVDVIWSRRQTLQQLKEVLKNRSGRLHDDL